MRSSALGKNISAVEIQAISTRGIWLFLGRTEYFLPYQDYPWFKEAKLSEIYNVRLLHGRHLYWPDIDVDLELESLKTPERYPLTYR